MSEDDISNYPISRMRRRRSWPWMRELVCENKISTNDLILPIFIKEGEGVQEEIESMPGVYRLSIDNLLSEVKLAKSYNIGAIALFPVIDKKLKSKNAKEAYNKNNLVCRAVRAIKEQINDIGVICDVALDPYTIHGHDGILKTDNNGNEYIDNDATVEILVKQSICLAKAGCDIIAPSDMMDGRVGKIRKALDKDDFSNIAILAYTAKYASGFYGPFRDAISSSANLGKADKKTYQMDIGNSKEAYMQAEQDIVQGADMIMVKPALPYLDIISNLSNKYDIPVFAYQVSGEYSMIKAASQRGWLDEKKILLESILAIKRAGARAIFTYYAVVIAKILKEDGEA